MNLKSKRILALNITEINPNDDLWPSKWSKWQLLKFYKIDFMKNLTWLKILKLWAATNLSLFTNHFLMLLRFFTAWAMKRWFSCGPARATEKSPICTPFPPHFGLLFRWPWGPKIEFGKFWHFLVWNSFSWSLFLPLNKLVSVFSQIRAGFWALLGKVLALEKSISSLNKM